MVAEEIKPLYCSLVGGRRGPGAVCTRQLGERVVLMQMSSEEEATQMLRLALQKLTGSQFRVVERRMEWQGCLASPISVRMREVPAHAWNEDIFRLLGNCVGRALMVDTKTTLKENLEVGRVKVFLDRASSLPTVISLWVQDIRFPVEIVAEDPEGWDREDLSEGSFLWSSSCGKGSKVVGEEDEPKE